METQTLRSTTVDKTLITRLSFPVTEVLSNPEKQAARRRQLELFTRLGNSYKGKVHITFEDQEGVKSVYTTIWATTEKNIILKGNARIPIHRIHSVSP